MAGGMIVNDVHDTSEDFDSAPTEGKRTYAILVCLFASLGGLFFGYDQGVTGGVLVMESFLQDFCYPHFPNGRTACVAKNLPSGWLDFTLLYNMMYNIGCIAGALFGGYVADKFGRRATIFCAGLLFCIGTTLVVVAPSNNYGFIYFARVIQGMGVGNSSFSLPIFGAEMAPKELRGFLSGAMQMTIVTGLLLANAVNLIVKKHENGWRTTNGVAMAAPIIVMCGIFFVPESPRWVYVHKGRDASEEALKRLRQTDNVSRELQAIADQIAEEGNAATWSEVFGPSIRKRVFIAMFLQILQQATGINPMFTYGGMIFKQVSGSGDDGIFNVFLLSTVNFLSTIPAMRWVDTYGRRQLLLLGAVGMILGHLLAGITFSVGCHGNTENAGCSNTAGTLIVIGTSFFIFNFAISWGPVCWIYPAEIFPLNVRAKAVSLSTMSNWIAGTVMTWVVKLFPSLNINGVFFLFAVTCTICGVYVYIYCPETKGLLLEDIECLFTSKHSTKRTPSPKYLELQDFTKVGAEEYSI